MAERWDVVAFGAELGTAYSELVDPVEQRRRLTAQSLLAAGGDPEAMELDEEFLSALEYAMPPTGGLGMGVDRLVMTLTGRNIRETDPVPAREARVGRRCRSRGCVIRRARTADVRGDPRAGRQLRGDRRLLSKATVTLYEDVQEFWVAEMDGDARRRLRRAARAVGGPRPRCARSPSRPPISGAGSGRPCSRRLLDVAREVGVRRVFCLTFETEFFGRHGFVEIHGTPVEHDVYEQLLQSYDEGVAEFLDLERVKPNTLGNTRMLRVL